MDQLKRFAFKFIAYTEGYAKPGREGLGHFFLGGRCLRLLEHDLRNGLCRWWSSDLGRGRRDPEERLAHFFFSEIRDHAISQGKLSSTECILLTLLCSGTL